MVERSILKKLTDRHRLFARYLAAGARQIDAYRAAGFQPKGRQGTALKSASIMANEPLIKELREQNESEARIRLGVTQDSLMLELEEARLLAIRLEKPGDAIAAIMAKAKLVGLIRDWKTEVNLNLIPKPAFKPGVSMELELAEWERQWSQAALPAPAAPSEVNGNGKGGNGHT